MRALVTPGGRRRPLHHAVAAYLDRLDADELRVLLHELSLADAGVLRALHQRASVARADPDTMQHDYVRDVDQTLALTGFVPYREAYEVAERAQALLTELQHLVDEGAGEVVLPALRLATERLRAILEDADDSSGEIGGAGQRAWELYARACCEVRPDPVELAEWVIGFRGESPGWPEVTLDDIVAAFDDAALARYRERLSALDAQGAGDSWRAATTTAMLLELADYDGDLDGAIALLARGPSPQFAQIIARLRAASRDDDALQWLDRAVAAEAVTARCPSRSCWVGAVDAVEHLREAGRLDTALAVARAVFTREPSEQSYRVVATVGEWVGRPDAERAWAIDWANERAERLGGALPIELALSDGDLDRAWASVDAYGAGTAWRRLAEASESSRPRRAADLYRPWLADALRVPNAPAYGQIAETLRTMRRLYALDGAEAEFASEIRELREQYRRRPSLMKALDAAGLPR